MTSLLKTTWALAIAALLPGTASPAVSDSSNSGFTVKLTLHVQAAPDEVYRKLIRNVGDWWNPGHTFSGDSHNLSIDERAGGCFCEKLPNGGGVRHLEVVHLAPGKTIVLSGALGPLQSIAAAGSLTIGLAPEQGGTKVDVTYAVTGYLAAGMITWAGPVDTVLTEQFTRLKNYVEHGNPAPK